MRFSKSKTSRPSQKSRFKASDYVPIWNQQHTVTTNLMAEMAFDRLGVRDVRSYFQQLAIPIALSSVIAGVVGAYHWGLQGAVLGVLAGIAAPAASVYLLLVLAYAAVLILAFVAAWAVILWVVFFVLTH